MASRETTPVSLLRTSERKRSGTVVSASVPWMLRSSDMVGTLGCWDVRMISVIFPTSQRPNILTVFVLLLLTACATTPSGPPTEPNDREWNLIGADYAWIESLRKAQAPFPPNASRKQMIEISLANLQKIEPTLNTFIGKVSEYYDRTHDPRA